MKETRKQLIITLVTVFFSVGIPIVVAAGFQWSSGWRDLVTALATPVLTALLTYFNPAFTAYGRVRGI